MTLLRSLSLAAVLVLAASTAALAQEPAKAAPGGWSTASNVGDLLDNPATKAVLLKDAPTTASSPRLEAEGRALSLDEIVPYSPELTPEVMAKINADLAKIPPK